MSKIEKLIQEQDEKYQHLETLELFNAKEFIKKYESCKKDDIRQSRIKNFKKLKKILGNEILDDGRKFFMIYEEDIYGMKLTVEEEGVYSKLRQLLVLDGSCRISPHFKSFTQYANEFKISRNRIKNIFENLKNNKLIWYEEIDNILLNPIYYRYGNHINNEKAIEVFHIALK